MKKLTALLLITVLLAFSLSGCVADTVDPPDVLKNHFTALLEGDETAFLASLDPATRAAIENAGTVSQILDENSEGGSYTDVVVTVNKYERTMTYTDADTISNFYDERSFDYDGKTAQLVEATARVTLELKKDGEQRSSTVDATALFTFVGDGWYLLDLSYTS